MIDINDLKNIAIRENEWERMALFWVEIAYAVHSRYCHDCQTEMEKTDHMLAIKADALDRERRD